MQMVPKDPFFKWASFGEDTILSTKENLGERPAEMKFFIQFAQSYLSFRLPELDSLLELNGLNSKNVYSMYVVIYGING